MGPAERNELHQSCGSNRSSLCWIGSVVLGGVLLFITFKRLVGPNENGLFVIVQSLGGTIIDR